MSEEIIPLYRPDTPDLNQFRDNLHEIWKSGQLSKGHYTEKVEQEIQRIHNVDHAIFTDSGTRAFEIISQSVEFDMFHMPAYTWASTRIMEKRIDFHDSPKILPDSPKHAPGAFVPTMTFGAVRTYDHERTIYDSTHCFGDERVGGRGIAEFLSFSPTKLMTACEGGAILTNNKQLANKCRRIRRYIGRPSELNALFLYLQLDNIQQKRLNRREILNKYLDNSDFLRYQCEPIDTNCPSEMSFWHPEAHQIRSQLSETCETRQRYKPPSPSFKDAYELYEHNFILPADVTEEEVKRICSRIDEIGNLLGGYQ